MNEPIVKEEPRVITPKEMQEQFFHNLWTQVKYWESVGGNGRPVGSRLAGLAFSFLSALDGHAEGLPAFDSYSCPHEDDKEYCRDVRKENWWPQRSENVTLHDAGMLHDKWMAFGRKHGYTKE